jgi:hypothetical protein
MRRTLSNAPKRLSGQIEGGFVVVGLVEQFERGAAAVLW